ncbi:rRNA maturation RNase YbeY [SAR202 cluster bacterium AC-409-J13_OGT_754m]|nr:rRNA maturation RNase YbeY [SAR202 cluster bacterium AC-409-J13_OGT_754m]
MSQRSIFHMVKRHVDISIQDPLLYPVSRSWLRKAVLTTLDMASPRTSYSVSLAICDDVTIKLLNKTFRGKDAITDVLAFSSKHQGAWQGDVNCPQASPQNEIFILPPKQLPPLGEIIISHPQMVRQAKKSKTSIDRELATLIIHGTLHLLGYDHEEPKQHLLMQTKSNQVTFKLFEHCRELK